VTRANAVRRGVIAAFFATLVLLAAVIFVSYHTMSRFAQVSRRAIRANARLLELEQTLSATRDAETGQRGFLLTGDSIYLAPYAAARANAAAHIDRLRALYADAPADRAVVDTMARLTTRKAAELDSSIAIYRARGAAAATRFVDVGTGKEVMDTLRRVAAAAEAREREALERDLVTRRASEQQSFAAVVALAVSSLLLLALALGAALRAIAERVRSEVALEQRVKERTAELEREHARAVEAAEEAERSAIEAEEASAEAEMAADEAERALAARLAAEQAQSAADVRHRAVVAQVQDYAIFTIDVDGRPTSWNEGVERTLGWSEAEFIGQDVHRIFTPEDVADGVPERELAHAAEYGTANNDRWMRRKNGERFFANGTTTALRDEQGRLIGYTKVMRDRTAQQVAEEALQRSEARYRTIARATREAIWDWDLETGGLEWNEGVEALFKYPLDSVSGDLDWWSNRVHPHDRDRVLGSIHAVLDGGGTYWSAEYRFARADGSWATVTDRGIVVRDGDGRVVRMLGTMADVSERRAAEREARLFVQVVEASTDFIGISGLDGRAFYVNEAGRRLVGLPDMEAVQRTSVLDYFPERDRPRVAERIWPIVLEQGRWNGDIRFRHFVTGEEVLVHWNVFLVRDRDTGVPIAVGCVSPDLTERRRVEEQLAQAQRMEAIGRLAGGIAHDLNNMLTAIMGHAMFLQQGFEPEDARRQDVAQITAAAERSAALTRSLLAFARRELVQPRQLDLNAVVREMERMLRPALGEGIDFELRLDPAAPTVMVDRSRIEQVILNLCLNARDAMPRGGRLTIETTPVHLDAAYAERHPGTVIRAGDYVRLGVTDTGVGMDAATQARIFEPFFTTKGVGEGTGLGLSTVYGSVKQAEGFVWVYSEPGHGSAFHVYLPASTEPATAPATPPAAPAAPRGAEETVLVVEDDDLVRDIACRTLVERGYRCLAARDGREALAIVGSYDGHLDLVVTDTVMPGMSGGELAARLAERFDGVRVLFMSGFTNDEVVRRGLMRRNQRFVQKPWTPETLAAAVRSALDGG
jgi:PAS domain S-box-containing protein